MTKFGRVAVLLFILLNCCVDPYAIKSVSYEPTLVVSGLITTEYKEHQVTLSRASPVTNAEFIPETGAQVSLVIGVGSLVLSEISPGVYVTPPLQGVVGQTYKLHITTTSGQQVVSDDVVLRNTPDIQNISATYSANESIGGETGVFKVAVTTEDPTGVARYYRWEYEETWEIQTPFESNFVWVGGNQIDFRTIPISTCYAGDTATSSIIKSTAGLTENKVSSQVIRSFVGTGPQVNIEYSILVRQYSLSQEGYFFWQTLNKINEGQGSLYDTQPGAVQGNLTSVNDGSLVLGYFDACVIKQSRAFLKPNQFPGYSPPIFSAYCNLLTQAQIPQSQIGAFMAVNPGMDIIGASGFGDPTIYLLPKQCCDCTSQGTNIKPSYWQ